MLLSGRSLVFIFLFGVLAQSGSIRRGNDKNLVALLCYLHGYKLGYEFSSQLPPIVPIIILPTVNQHQSVSIKTVFDKKSDTSVPKSQGIPVRLTSINSTELDDEFNHIPLKPKDSVKRDTPSIDNHSIEEDTLRQAIVSKYNTDANLPSTISPDVTRISLNGTELTTSEPTNNTTELSPGVYPIANYDNEIVKNLTFTTIEDSFDSGLPPMEDNRWQNFDNKSSINMQPTSTTERYSIGTTRTNNVAPYPAAVYGNNYLDHISLTTEVYVTDRQQLPAQNNKWQTFNDFKQESSGDFKPLAGLYYDGYLTRPLKKQQFIPRYGYNYYF